MNTQTKISLKLLRFSVSLLLWKMKCCKRLEFRVIHSMNIIMNDFLFANESEFFTSSDGLNDSLNIRWDGFFVESALLGPL